MAWTTKFYESSWRWNGSGFWRGAMRLDSASLSRTDQARMLD